MQNKGPVEHREDGESAQSQSGESLGLFLGKNGQLRNRTQKSHSAPKLGSLHFCFPLSRDDPQGHFGITLEFLINSLSFPSNFPSNFQAGANELCLSQKPGQA